MDLMDDEEEILIVLAQSLNSQFLDHVGGHLFATHLFKPLERLCEVEESTIREKVRPTDDLNCVGCGKHQEHIIPCQCEGHEAANYLDD